MIMIVTLKVALAIGSIIAFCKSVTIKNKIRGKTTHTLQEMVAEAEWGDVETVSELKPVSHKIRINLLLQF